MIKQIQWRALKVRARGCARGNRAHTQPMLLKRWKYISLKIKKNIEISTKTQIRNIQLGVSAVSARATARAHFWCTSLHLSDHLDDFWRLDCECILKSHKNMQIWKQTKKIKILTFFKNFNFLKIFQHFQNFYEFFEFFANFNQFYFFVFLSYNNDQVVKNHLLDQTNSMARIKSARARLRARYATKHVPHKMLNLPIFSALAGCERGFRARALLVRVIEFSWSWRWFLTIW